jgi:hypothetical protein
MAKLKENKAGEVSLKQMILGYFTVLAIMLMLFGTLLLPSTHINSQNEGLIDELGRDIKTSAYTPFANNEFIFYWSPIDPLYDQADTEQQHPWGLEYGVNNDYNCGQINQETRRSISFYGDTYISDEGAIAIGSYDDNNKITVTLLKGHQFTDYFKMNYPKNNSIHNSNFEVMLPDADNNGKPDKYSDWIDLMDPARAPLKSPDLVKVENVVIWSGTLSKFEGILRYTTSDWWIWDGVIKVESTGRVTVQKMTVTDKYIDKNDNGIPDLGDDVDPDNYNDDDEVSHGVNTAWFANGMSDDAIWSFYGDEFFGFIHRDLMIASYDDDNNIKITDLSDGDDSKEITLDVWENYQWVSTFVVDTTCGGNDAGNNNELDDDYYYFGRNVNWNDRTEAQEAMNSDYVKRAIDSGNFEADWVHIKADKPVTLYGGIWDNNFHTQAYGFLGSRYYVPMSTAITITGLERESHVELDYDDTSIGDDQFSIEPGEQITIKSMAPRPFSNNYVAEVQWLKIISDWPIRVEIWMANDDNAFDETQISTFLEGYDYIPAREKWDLAIHHRTIVYIIALEDDTFVGWDGTWLDNEPSGAVLNRYEIYRIVVDSNEDYNGDEEDDTEPDNQDELESVMQMLHVNADKEVLLQVRYARDYSCEPQDMDIVLSHKPTIQRTTTGDPFWLLPSILAVLMAVDVGIVATGGKGIVGTLSFTGKGKFLKNITR